MNSESRESQTFNQRFDQYGQWRASFGQELAGFAGWLETQGLLNSATQERLSRLQEQAAADKITVAFVAEYSRGKSEMINALFFASYGRRIMPASAGRTTMCPVELTWDASYPPGVRLLPIETRKLSASLADWKLKPSAWDNVALDARSADSVADALQRVTEVIEVNQDEARRLGFWNDEDASDNPPVNAAGAVEVPKWRHAVINFPHPLLKRGMVILDTPGLNAIGAEPELTVNLLPQAQAVIFILGTDTGVTRSDQQIWQEHLSRHVDSLGLRLIVLNKIDMLWDGLTSPQEQAEQIKRQRRSVAQTLGVPPNHVIAVSAQKALLAKINKDEQLLRASSIRQLESILVDTLLGQRHVILYRALLRGLSDIRNEAKQLLGFRLRDLTERIQELGSLQGKNNSARRSIRMRIARERKEFDNSVSKILSLRAAQNKLLNDAFHQLGAKTIKNELNQLGEALQGKILTLGFQKRFLETFANLKEVIESCQAIADQMQRMLADSYDSLNTEFGFALQPPTEVDLRQFMLDLDKIADGNKHHFSVTNALKFSSSEFSARLVSAISMRLRSVFEAASSELELWSKTATAPLDVQLKERRHNFINRSETIERIEKADLDLTERLKELHEEAGGLKHIADQLQQRCEQLELSLHTITRTLNIETGASAAQPAPAQPRPPAEA
ncbi:dynamin family protein [Allofranklinella schreckenbergeri]|uniref:Dynamin family protein n=1 Tax=Allofranklinella schreckenbergeri TaxID=1076744 RepID=A0A3M6QE05_9BURK|nr:dynamin family protein [Allofranklinella schreckenbergeri]RMX01358.1 dynamin family protein [Allofranklinella schreckenbergeri]